jgi:hypothetical protein
MKPAKSQKTLISLNELHRREFLKLSLGALGTLALGPLLGSPFGRAAWAGPAAEPHFFLQVMIPSGFDSSYLFDARPLAMSSAATPLIQNYLGKEPAPWTGENGQGTWATELALRLAPHRKRFSVVNGVVMSKDFDGHGQCINILFNGAAEAGESFIPILNRSGGLKELSLDAVQMGRFALQQTNAERTLPLNPELARKLQGKFATSGGPVTDPKNPAYAFLRSRYEAIALGNGLFSGGAAALLEATGTAPELIAKFRAMSLPAVPTGVPGYQPNQDYERFPALLNELFRGGIARSAVLTVTETYPFQYDVHDPKAAKDMPARAGALADLLASLFKGLTETQFDSARSLLDVTTVLVSSEFTRTMRQVGKPIDATGTDHNTFSNTMLVAGKGVRGGCVFGESDHRAAGEKLSGAHLKVDPRQVKFVGRPFDFAKSEALPQALPAEFAMADYLTCASVINTLYSLFGVPEEKHRLVERFGKKAPIVPGLLS